jgi:hypothetical protein
MVSGAPINVKDYGALNGVDDTAAINAAIAACTGGAIYFPAGTYIVKGRLDLSHITSAGYRIYGDGEATNITLTGATAGFFTEYTSGGIDDHPIRIIENMIITGDGTSSQIGINAFASLIQLNNLFIIGCDIGLKTSGYVVQVNNCHFKTNVTSGVECNDSTTTVFVNCYWRGQSSSAVRFTGTAIEGISFVNCAIEGNSGEAISIENTVAKIQILFNATYFELDGYQSTGVKSIRNDCSTDKSFLTFDTCKLSYNVLGPQTSGDYKLGSHAIIRNSQVSGNIQVSVLELHNNHITDASFIGLTGEPCKLVYSEGNEWGAGFIGSYGYVFDIGTNVSSVVDCEATNLIATATTYPMGVTVTTASISSTSFINMGFGANAEVIYAASVGSSTANCAVFGSVNTTIANGRFWSCLISSEINLNLGISATGDAACVTFNTYLTSNKVYRLAMYGGRSFAGFASIRLYPLDATGPKVSINATYAAPIVGFDGTKIGSLFSGNIPVI